MKLKTDLKRLMVIAYQIKISFYSQDKLKFDSHNEYQAAIYYWHQSVKNFQV